MDIKIRFAIVDDTALILRFIKELAEYEEILHTVVATEEILMERIFGTQKYVDVVLAFVNNIPAGYIAFSYSFSTFLGKPGIYLENLYVTPNMRRKGVAKRLLSFLANIILERDYGRLELAVLEWNKSTINFYEKIGAKPIQGLIIERFTKESIEELIKLI